MKALVASSAYVLALTLAAAASGCSDGAPGEPETGLSDALRTQFGAAHAAFDLDSDGRVTRDELSSGDLTFNDQRTGESLTGDAAIDAWFATFDLNADGAVELDEMLQVYEELAAEHGDAR
ncbi:MAG: EF-hand domain-containing protein [Oceanicaulis sp.]